MTMNLTPANLSRGLLDAGGAGNDRDMALDLFAGQVLNAYRQKVVFYDMKSQFMSFKQLDHGNSAKWPILGQEIDLETITGSSPSDDVYSEFTASGGLAGGYHSPGDFIEGRRIKMSEATVRVDDHLVSAIDLPTIDISLAHFPLIAPMATKLGNTLARDNDRKIAAVVRKAAKAEAVTGVYAGGNAVYRSGAATVTSQYADSPLGSSKFRDDVAALAEKFDNAFVGEDQRVLFVTPYIRKILRHEATLWGTGGDGTAGTEAIYGPAGNIYSKDTSSAAWDINRRTIGMLEGFKVVVTNSMPGDWLLSTGTRYEQIDTNLAKYDFDCDGGTEAKAQPAALAMCGATEGNAAIGMVQAGGIQTHSETDHRRNVQFLKAQMLVGYDVLCPWCAGMIATHA